MYVKGKLVGPKPIDSTMTILATNTYYVLSARRIATRVARMSDGDTWHEYMLCGAGHTEYATSSAQVQAICGLHLDHLSGE